MRHARSVMALAVLLIVVVAAAAFADGYYGSAPEYMRHRYGPHYAWSRACHNCNTPNYRACGTVQAYQTRPFFLAGSPDNSLGCATCNVCVAPPLCPTCSAYVAPPTCTACASMPEGFAVYWGATPWPVG